MKAVFALILYFIVLLFNFDGILGEALLMDFVDSQLSAPTPCNFSSDCHHLKNAVCMDDYCNCNGSKFCVSNLEQRLLKLGENCESSSDCLIENSVCQERKCRCIEGTAAGIDGRKCIKGQESVLNANNQCNNEGCQCKAGYVSNLASTECLKIAEELYSACAEDVQCLSKFENSICHEGLCRCNESFKYDAIDNMCSKDLSFITGSLNESDSRTPTGCVDGICKEQEVELSLKADNPRIGALCDGFRKEQKIGCTVGRCECPEERKFCTNRAELSRHMNKGQSKKRLDSRASSVDSPKIEHISRTYTLGRFQQDLVALVKYHVPFIGSFAGAITIIIFGFSIQAICAYSKWRGMVALCTLIFFLTCWLIYLIYQLELGQLVLTYFYLGAILCFGFLFFIVFFAILERHQRHQRYQLRQRQN
ncbi:prion-like-(Q/N-rich) domain-bearing protein 25 isoform X1 [Dendroctonus ponderosae]|uniref:EB domain-containing protein n=1 Tax=Dendroctonus ponderosae TaxID=77166 RepID=A0AAR5NXI0_DENPD|nr:prion-like-(Q/N-rich) domain-bearing protein 25 isoform X1 [Dendroctonus ponderosae]